LNLKRNLLAILRKKKKWRRSLSLFDERCHADVVELNLSLSLKKNSRSKCWVYLNDDNRDLALKRRENLSLRWNKKRTKTLGVNLTIDKFYTFCTQ
jgi:hypothetical protein